MYNAYFLVLFLTFVGFTTSQLEVYRPGDNIEETIRNVLECIKVKLKDSPLDPLYIKDREIVLDGNQWVQGHYYIISWVLRGLSDFEVRKMDVSLIPPKLEFSLFFNIDLRGKYRADGTMIYIVPFNGEGDVDVKLGLDIFGKIIIGTEIEELYLFFEAFPNFNITGLIYDDYMSWLMSKQLDLIVDDLVNEYQEEISKVVSPIVQTVLNFLLKLYLRIGKLPGDGSVCDDVDTMYEALATKKMNF